MLREKSRLVEIRETVREIIIPKYIEIAHTARPKPLLFTSIGDQELLSYGVPPEWLADVRKANEDTLLQLADHLPAEAAEALLDLATGAQPKFAQQLVSGVDPFKYPDAQHRFRIMNNLGE